jgi:hypothetical protein
MTTRLLDGSGSVPEVELELLDGQGTSLDDGGCTHDEESTSDDELIHRLELDQPEELPAAVLTTAAPRLMADGPRAFLAGQPAVFDPQGDGAVVDVQLAALAADVHLDDADARPAAAAARPARRAARRPAARRRPQAGRGPVTRRRPQAR